MILWNYVEMQKIPINRTRGIMNRFESLILTNSHVLTIDEIDKEVYLPYIVMFTARPYKEDDEMYILVEITKVVNSLGHKFLVKNIIFN